MSEIQATITLRSKEKTLSCKETLVLGSRTTFTFVDEKGVQLEEDGWAVLRNVLPPRIEAAATDGIDVAAFDFVQGVQTTDVLKDGALVWKLSYLPVGTVTTLSMTVVLSGGVVAMGEVAVLVPTIAEITNTPPWDPMERVALFKGQKGNPGVDIGNKPPDEYMPKDVRVYINEDGLATTIREVPLKPKDGMVLTTYTPEVEEGEEGEDAEPVADYRWEKPTYPLIRDVPSVSGGSEVQVLITTVNPETGARDYQWGALPLPTVLPRALAINNGELQLVGYTLNSSTMQWEETNTVLSSISLTTHSADHTEGVL